MTTLVDEGGLSSCRCSPEHEDEVVASAVEGGDGSVGERLPSVSAVAKGLMLADGETRVEQEDALSGPSHEVARSRDGRARLGLHLLEDVLKRRREGDAVVHAETKSVGLPGTMIGVLPEYDDAHLVEGRRVEGIEDEAPGRIASAGSVLLSHELRQLGEVRLTELRSQLLLPGRFYLYIHFFLFIGQRYEEVREKQRKSLFFFVFPNESSLEALKGCE